MPGLKQAVKLANERLEKHLHKYGYAPCAQTPALWIHSTLPITFTLVVNDFSVKYTGKHTALHLLKTLRDLYMVSIHYTGPLYCGLTIKWDYRSGTVDISMPGYIAQALHKFKQPLMPKREDAPHKWNRPIYGAKQQFSETDDAGPLFPPPDIKHVQTVSGTLLYYALAVYNTMLVALGDLALEQTRVTQKTLYAITQLLNYAATHPDATVRYNRSGMVIRIHSDVSYLSVPKAHSRACSDFFLSSNSNYPATCTPNGPIHIIAKILCTVMGSAAEAEISASYTNGQESIPIRTVLE